jgi:hypothetical protein
MMMWFLILFIAAVVTICAVSVWSLPGSERDPAGEHGEAGRTGGEPEAVPGSAVPGSLEGVLAGQLMSGRISRAQYRRAIEGLAARDEDRHPLAVPPENGASAEG